MPTFKISWIALNYSAAAMAVELVIHHMCTHTLVSDIFQIVDAIVIRGFLYRDPGPNLAFFLTERINFVGLAQFFSVQMINCCSREYSKSRGCFVYKISAQCCDVYSL